MTRWAARLQSCRRCRSDVIQAMCDAAYVALVEPWPITRTAELAYYLAGRPTYGWSRYDPKRHLRYRWPWWIKRDVDPWTQTFVDHVCGQPVPPAARQQMPAPARDLEECPF